MGMADMERAEHALYMDRRGTVMSQGEPLVDRAESAPDDMSEIPRELTMIRGAVASLHEVTNDLLGKIAPTIRDVPEDEAANISEIPTPLPVTTELSKALREIHDEVSTIENKVARAVHKSEL